MTNARLSSSQNDLDLHEMTPKASNLRPKLSSSLHEDENAVSEGHSLGEALQEDSRLQKATQTRAKKDENSAHHARPRRAKSLGRPLPPSTSPKNKSASRKSKEIEPENNHDQSPDADVSKTRNKVSYDVDGAVKSRRPSRAPTRSKAKDADDRQGKEVLQDRLDKKSIDSIDDATELDEAEILMELELKLSKSKRRTKSSDNLVALETNERDGAVMKQRRRRTTTSTDDLEELAQRRRYLRACEGDHKDSKQCRRKSSDDSGGLEASIDLEADVSKPRRRRATISSDSLYDSAPTMGTFVNSNDEVVEPLDQKTSDDRCDRRAIDPDLEGSKHRRRRRSTSTDGLEDPLRQVCSENRRASSRKYSDDILDFVSTIELEAEVSEGRLQRMTTSPDYVDLEDDAKTNMQSQLFDAGNDDGKRCRQKSSFYITAGDTAESAEGSKHRRSRRSTLSSDDLENLTQRRRSHHTHDISSEVTKHSRRKSNDDVDLSAIDVDTEKTKHRSTRTSTSTDGLTDKVERLRQPKDTGDACPSRRSKHGLRPTTGDLRHRRRTKSTDAAGNDLRDASTLKSEKLRRTKSLDPSGEEEGGMATIKQKLDSQHNGSSISLDLYDPIAEPEENVGVDAREERKRESRLGKIPSHGESAAYTTPVLDPAFDLAFFEMKLKPEAKPNKSVLLIDKYLGSEGVGPYGISLYNKSINPPHESVNDISTTSLSSILSNRTPKYDIHMSSSDASVTFGSLSPRREASCGKSKRAPAALSEATSFSSSQDLLEEWLEESTGSSVEERWVDGVNHRRLLEDCLHLDDIKMPRGKDRCIKHNDIEGRTPCMIAVDLRDLIADAIMMEANMS